MHCSLKLIFRISDIVTQETVFLEGDLLQA